MCAYAHIIMNSDHIFSDSPLRLN